MQPSNTGPVRPVLEGEPSDRSRWWAAGAVALALVLLIVVLLALGRDGAVEETTVATSVPATSTMAVATTSGATTTTTVATTTTTLAALGLDALGSFQAKPLPPEAACPAGSTPDTPGDPSTPRPPWDSLGFYGSVSAAFDRESGLLVALFQNPDDDLASTWTFDPCRNRWREMEADGLALGAASMGEVTYDADSDLIVAIDETGVVWAYDTSEDTWTPTPWTPGKTMLPVNWSSFYHERSGLLVLYDEWPKGAPLWAYDIDTDGRYQVGGWDPPLGQLFHRLFACGFSPGMPCVQEFYIVHFFSGPASTTWWYQLAIGWQQMNIATPSPPCVEAGDLFDGTLAFDEATGRALVFCGTTLFATFDPVLQEWEVTEGSEEGPGGFWGDPVYDSANDRLIFVGLSMWAFDGRTEEWIELLPAE